MTFKKVPSIKILQERKIKESQREALKRRSDFMLSQMTLEQREIFDEALKKSINIKQK